MKKLVVVIIILSVFITHVSASNLESQFKNPPHESKPQTWWHWFGGHVSKEGITKDLEAMKRVGIGGVQNFHVGIDTPPGPISYDSPEWHELIKHAISEANRLGIEYGFHNCAGWSSTGGVWITPEHAMKQVVWSEKTVEVTTGNSEMKFEMARPDAVRDFYCDIAVLAFPQLDYEAAKNSSWQIDNWQKKSFKYPHAKLTITPARLKRDTRKAPATAVINFADIVDLSPYVNSDKAAVPTSLLTGHPKWTVIRFGFTETTASNSPADKGASGLECDKMSTEAIDVHWDHLIASIIKDAGDNKSIFTNILVDSFEKNYQNWTKGFGAEFRNRRGYEISRWLPAMTGRVVNSVDQTERFLWDLRKTCAELINQNYFGYMAKRSHADNLTFSLEPYGMGNFDEMGAALIADMPMGEFWAGRYDERTPRIASSAGHVMGRKYVGAEAFTSHGMTVWKTNPESLKAQGDFYFAKGINRLIYHTYVHQPWSDNIKPGMNMGRFGFNFNRNNTWFELSKPYLDYVARTQYMLQSGKPVKDILYVYGECVPTDSQLDVNISPKVPVGYGFDKVGHQVLTLASVKNGKIVFPSGMQYSVLALVHAERTTPEFLAEIDRLISSGATIVADRPIAAPGLQDYPRCDVIVKKYVEKLWDSGKIAAPEKLAGVLAKLGLGPDFKSSVQGGIEYTHHKDGETEWYFVANIESKAKTLDCSFRVSGRVPEIWDAETGSIRPSLIWQQTQSGNTNVQLMLAPNQSRFVVFRKAASVTGAKIVSSRYTESPDDRIEKDKVISAFYGLAGSPSKQVDVTDKIITMIENGNNKVRASNGLAGKDPAEGVVKSLRVEAIVDGKKVVLSAREGQHLDLSKLKISMDVLPAWDLAVNDTAVIYRPGKINLELGNGRKQTFSSRGAKTTALTGKWQVQFGEFGPNELVTFDTLIPWNESSNKKIKYYSGTASYKTSFSYSKPTDSRYVLLDLGRVRNIARVRLNGKDLGILWKAPYVVNVADVIKSGQNYLEIEVTNLVINRVIGDEQYPEVSTARTSAGPLSAIPDWVSQGKPNPDPGRHLFFTYKYFKKASPLIDSGLIGEVRIVEPDIIVVK